MLDCILESLALSRAQESAPSNGLIGWWMNQCVLFLPVAWVIMLLEPAAGQTWLVVTAALAWGLTLIGIAAALPWGAFYLVHGIARGFTGAPERGN